MVLNDYVSISELKLSAVSNNYDISDYNLGCNPNFNYREAVNQVVKNGSCKVVNITTKRLQPFNLLRPTTLPLESIDMLDILVSLIIRKELVRAVKSYA